ncbi:CypX Cytochrome P450 [Pyrenophora tritici-repentis]|nr:Cytochrome P450 [Pyrenophora tritici-repentis]KAA8617282.1 Cytochrome P450 [Pyrenophora tritici-repentis]KAF7446533.1 Cytochrome P450 [Pyrenophora tritici-repentis]KAF7446568.1 Cytochrome P450 [Pyrenophora tritici-repentis]KAF7448755.1 Cytochrome P450 [Pyrenophora tritici-repentis]
MEEPHFRYVVEAIEKSNVRLGVLMQAPELALSRGFDRQLFFKAKEGGAKFVKFLRELLQQRLKKGPAGPVKDIFSFLQQCKHPDSSTGLSPIEISTETATFIVAGTDTTSTAMASLSHYLSWSPRCYSRAREEVRTIFDSEGDIVFGPKLNSCVFLRACLDEALRITPPAGGPLWREVEIGGTQINGDYIPAGCEVGSGIYAMHRSPQNWSDPDTYIPERWLPNKGAAKSENQEHKNLRQPYFPFNIGPRSCVGKPLAIAQIMLTFAHLLWKFDFRIADAEELCSTIDDIVPPEYMLQDYISGQKHGPILQFCSRS